MNHDLLKTTDLAALREQVAADLQPVSARGERWLWWLFGGFSLVSLCGSYAFFGLREDHQELGTLWTWGLTACQFMVACVLLAVTLREASPGRYLGRGVLWASAVAALAVHTITTWLTFWASPVVAPEGIGYNYSLVCLGLELALGVPIGLLALWFLARGVVSRPLFVGLLGGLGAGLAGDAVWRIICPYSDHTHVLTSHTLGILAVSLLTFGVALVWERRRLHRWRDRVSRTTS